MSKLQEKSPDLTVDAPRAFPSSSETNSLSLTSVIPGTFNGSPKIRLFRIALVVVNLVPVVGSCFSCWLFLLLLLLLFVLVLLVCCSCFSCCWLFRSLLISLFDVLLVSLVCCCSCFLLLLLFSYYRGWVTILSFLPISSSRVSY